MIKKFAIIIIIFSFILIFKNYELINDNIIKACNLFLTNIFPSIFPMFVISSMLLNLNCAKYIGYIFNLFTKKLFKLSKNSTYILFMSILSGFPSNAKLAKDMYDEKMITKKEVQKIILFTHFSNPLFIISMVKHKTILVLVSHYISNFITAFILRNKYISNNTLDSDKIYTDKTISDIFFESISGAINTLMYILGTIVTFYIISSIINNPFSNVILELSQGLNYIDTLNISVKLKTLIMGGLLSFGGLCIHFQVYGILNNIKIKYLPYFFSRILHALLTILIIYIFY